MRATLTRPGYRHTGFSYIEVLIAVVLVGVSLAPALDALKTGMMAASTTASVADDEFYLKSKMEQVLAQPFADLDAAAQVAGSSGVATSYSDPSGVRRRLVYISRYDADNADADNNRFTGTEANLLWVQVQFEGTTASLTTLSSQ